MSRSKHFGKVTCGFPRLSKQSQRVVDAHRAEDLLTFESIAAADDWARREAATMIQSASRS